MNILNNEFGRRCLLACQQLVILPDQRWECHCQCFDDSPFTIVVDEDKIRVDLANKTKGWVEVIRHGVTDHTASITLPAPSIRFGTRVRVKETAILEIA